MKTTSLLLLCTTLLAALSSCRQGDENPAAGSPGEIVPEVAVLTVHGTQVPVTANLPGRMEAYLQAEVRARVTGIIQERCYQEGQTVRPGDLLFKIDPARRAGRRERPGARRRQGRAGGCGGQGRPLFLPGGQGRRQRAGAQAGHGGGRPGQGGICRRRRVSGAGPPESGIHQGGSAHLRPRAPRAGDGRGICQPERIHAPDHH